jgi:hypothetical protein
VGTRNGRVYCLSANDGTVIWNKSLAPDNSRIVVFGQMESPWPVVGGVLVVGEAAYAVLGRHSSVDGGILICALDSKTGDVYWRKRIGDAQGTILAAGLSYEGNGILAMGSWKFDRFTGEDSWVNPWETAPVYPRSTGNRGTARMDWRGRSFFGRTTVRWAELDRQTATFVFGGRFAKPALSAGHLKEKGDDNEVAWSKEFSKETQYTSLVLTPKHIYAAGRLEDMPGKGILDEQETEISPYGIVLHAQGDGEILSKFVTDADVAIDGLAVVNDRLLACTLDGAVYCLGNAPR